ncbi:hypothetical protein DRQ07_00925 [candidate division KSB1 bacterium]|nr:MAG: hypothetical protein DRQ07_00925 [candidate division KSB1 bacterium]
MMKITDILKKYKTHIYGISACLLILIILILVTDLVIMPVYTHHGVEQELPDITELKFEDAQKILSEKGFQIVKDGEKFDDNYEAGTIISQNPLPFTMVKKGRRIYVIVSAGEKMVKVPKVTGSSEREAKFILRQAGLTLGEIFYEYDQYYPKDVVCGQSIAENMDVQEQDTVDITVSLGQMPSVFIVPDLEGRSLDEAKMIIRKAGLKVGEITYQKNKKLLPDTVIGQDPSAGEETGKGAQVDLTVSTLKDDEEIE